MLDFFHISSMVCIQKELNQMGIRPNNNDQPYDQNNVVVGGGGAMDSNVEINNIPCQSRWTSNGGAFGAGGGASNGGGGSGGGSGAGKTTGFMENILGCMKPLLFSFSYKSSDIATTNMMDQWEIPFVDILDMEWVGSGAQGTVFSGKLKNEIVAVKRVRHLKETDIKHLRKLDHENIIKFK